MDKWKHNFIKAHGNPKTDNETFNQIKVSELKHLKIFTQLVPKILLAKAILSQQTIWKIILIILMDESQRYTHTKEVYSVYWQDIWHTVLYKDSETKFKDLIHLHNCFVPGPVKVEARGLL